MLQLKPSQGGRRRAGRSGGGQCCLFWTSPHRHSVTPNPGLRQQQAPAPGGANSSSSCQLVGSRDGCAGPVRTALRPAVWVAARSVAHSLPTPTILCPATPTPAPARDPTHCRLSHRAASHHWMANNNKGPIATGMKSFIPPDSPAAMVRHCRCLVFSLPFVPSCLRG